MRIIILFVLFVSICFECIGQCGKDTIFLKKKYCKLDVEIIENDSDSYYLPKYVETIKHDTIPLINRGSQIIYGNCVLLGTQGRLRAIYAYIDLDSVKVEKVDSVEKYYHSIDSIISIEEKNNCYIVNVIVDYCSDGEFFLFDINQDSKTKCIELWAYPYGVYGGIGLDIKLYKLTYYLTKTNDKKKFKFKFRRIINYDYN